MTERLIFELIVPILMLIVGWLTSAYRNKQKKEKDTLDNVQQIIDIQNKHIERCELTQNKLRELLERKEQAYNKLEAKLEIKIKAVKEAYDCPHDTSLCPVLIYDKKNHVCDTCERRDTNCRENANCQD